MTKSTTRTLHSSTLLLSTAFFMLATSLSFAETCGPEGCALPSTSFYGQTTSEQVPGSEAPVAFSNFRKLPSAPPLLAKPGGTKTTVQQEARKPAAAAVAKKPEHDPAKAPLLTGFTDNASPEEEVLYGPTQRIGPEGTSQVFLSSSDINRVICPVEIKDAIYSKE
ncbi:MAG: hypothetical protein ABSC55_15665, partial [Syntrophorhabdales bacterium]